MALRIFHVLVHRAFVARPLSSLRKFASQAQTDPSQTDQSSNVTDQIPRPAVDDVSERFLPVIPENNPLNLNDSHIGYLYRVPETIVENVFYMGGFPKQFRIQADMFQEYCIMVRQPALEIINNLKNADYSKPAVRQVIYGKYGCGKTLTLAHVLHYAYKADYLLVHVPWVNNFTRRAVTVSPSVYIEGAVDVPHDGANWLYNFKVQNHRFLSNPDLVTRDHYQWNDHEHTEKGKPLLELIDYGFNRKLYSNVVLETLLREIKYYSTAGVIKTLVLIDGFNGFLVDYVKSKKRIISKGKPSLARAFLDITKFNWCNGAIVLSVDRMDYPLDGKELYKPYELLGKEGWEHLDPFIPVGVGNYTYTEAKHILEYYLQKNWLVNPAAKTKEGQDELIALSGLHPLKLLEVCDPL